MFFRLWRPRYTPIENGSIEKGIQVVDDMSNSRPPTGSREYKPSTISEAQCALSIDATDVSC